MERAYRDVVQELKNQNIRYEAFDFHAECRKMQWHRLDILMARLTPDQEQMGYFLLTRDGVLVSVQDGIFRTNCIDCLDRTNVVQSMLAKRVLSDALSKLEILRNVDEHPSVEFLFKQVIRQTIVLFFKNTSINVNFQICIQTLLISQGLG